MPELNIPKAAENDPNAPYNWDDCPLCNGSGKIDGDSCMVCDGTGTVDNHARAMFQREQALIDKANT